MSTSSDVLVAEAPATLPADVDLHARPAATLVRAAMRFSSRIQIAVDEREVDAKSLLSVLGLGARRGTTVCLRAQGEDAAEAIAALRATVAGLRD